MDVGNLYSTRDDPPYGLQREGRSHGRLLKIGVPEYWMKRAPKKPWSHRGVWLVPRTWHWHGQKGAQRLGVDDAVITTDEPADAELLLSSDGKLFRIGTIDRSSFLGGSLMVLLLLSVSFTTLMFWISSCNRGRPVRLHMHVSSSAS